jgi:thioredoxin reductase
MNKGIVFDVIIIGGSYSGLSAAMALGRSMRRVLIIDSGQPCNQPTPHSHNFITQDGVEPGLIAQAAQEQVLKYPTVEFIQGLAVDGKATNEGYEITTSSGATFKSEKLLFATGIKDLMPDIKGFSDCWGKTVIHCPYCHGYEFRGKKTGIMANGDKAFHLASLVNNLTDQLCILTAGQPTFSSEQLKKLEAHKIEVIESEISEIGHQNGSIRQVVFSDGKKRGLDAAYAAIPFEQHCRIPRKLGCELTEMGLIQVDMMQKSSVPGIFACGDNASPMRSVAYAVAAGNVAGAMINMELTQAKF